MTNESARSTAEPNKIDELTARRRLTNRYNHLLKDDPALPMRCPCEGFIQSNLAVTMQAGLFEEYERAATDH